jgi:hypothetical protein
LAKNGILGKEQLLLDVLPESRDVIRRDGIVHAPRLSGYRIGLYLALKLGVSGLGFLPSMFPRGGVMLAASWMDVME